MRAWLGVKTAVLSLLLDVERARKDPAGAQAVLDQLSRTGDAGAARALVRKKLDEVACDEAN